MSLLGTSSDDSWLINIALLGSRGIGYFIVTYLYGVFWIPNPLLMEAGRIGEVGLSFILIQKGPDPC
jgi:hypothetical protein